jgi:predicted metal-dependent peptidase
VVLPTLQSNELPAIVVAVDTSGSIDKPALARFLAAVSDALGAYETTAHVVCCDARVQSVAEYSTADLPIDVQPAGGGGTDFRPVFDWVDRERIEPAALIYFTDLDCYKWPDGEPDYPVLWVTPGPTDRRAPWGDVVTMPEGGA